MANSVLLTTIVIVVSSSVNSERRSFLSYSKNFQKAVPHFWKHDQEELNRNLDKNSRQSWGEMRVGPHPPPLRPNPPASWILGTHQVENELTQNRVNELKNKLIPKNIAHVRAFNQPNPKPKFELKNSLVNKRHKRDVTQVENDREKRELIINPQIKPEMVMQPHLQPALVQEVENQGVRPKLNFHFYNPSIYYPEVIEALSNSTGPYQDKIIEKRDKRQILLMINQRPLQPLELAKKPRTTPNPFIRDTNIADYDIVKPESYKPEVEVVNSMDTDSYQLSESSELDYESDYTISMSDSEDWENYPLTTPSGPNPGWGLPTLADMYQRPHQRVKRSPKQRKRKIGEYKRKLKERRKRKEAKRKRRIIRNSKEDKAVKEEIKEEDIIEKFLQKPKIKPRKTAYQEDISKEVLWSNGTHRIIEDPNAKFEWINRTHYKILKDNATDQWYKQTHVLVYGEEYWANRTKELGTLKPKLTKIEEEPDEDYSDDYDEEFTQEEEEETAIKIQKSKKYDKKKEIKEKSSQKKTLMEKVETESDKISKKQVDPDSDNKGKKQVDTETDKKSKKQVDTDSYKKRKKQVVPESDKKSKKQVDTDSDKKIKNQEELMQESKSKEEKVKKKKSVKKVKKEKVKKTIKKVDETEDIKDKISKKKKKTKDSEKVESDSFEKGKINEVDEKVTTKKEDKIVLTRRRERKEKLKVKKKKLIEKVETEKKESTGFKSLEKAESDQNEDESLLKSELKSSEDKTLNKAMKKLGVKSQPKKQTYKKGFGKKGKTSKSKIEKP